MIQLYCGIVIGIFIGILIAGVIQMAGKLDEAHDLISMLNEQYDRMLNLIDNLTPNEKEEKKP